MSEDVYEAFDSVESTYISLIQQYLSLFLVDNATFLAERMVAHRPTLQAVYLLGICYYRGGSPQRARSVLVQKSKEAFAGISHSSSSGAKTDGNLINQQDLSQHEVLCNAMLYLLATCCYDLVIYTEAEDHLLRGCYQKFALVQQQRNQQSSISKNRSLDMDDWIVQTHPCPIPNGAAGLHLLGKISLKRDRPKRAERYFRMSLKLDPLLWTSYQALCDMGVASSDLNDPIKVFGVAPPTNHPSNEKDEFMTHTESYIPTIQEEGADDDDGNYQGKSASMTPADAFSRNQSLWHTKADAHPRAQTSMKDESLNKHSAPFATPVTPSTIPFNHDLLKPVFGVKKEDQESGKDHITGARTSLPTATLFHTSSRHSSSDARGGKRSSGVGSKNINTSMNHPTSSVIFNTPGLTPIPKSENRMSLDPSQHLGQPFYPNTTAYSALDSFTIGNTTQLDVGILSRAKTVAHRMYYHPSPETTPPHAITTAPPSSMKVLRGKRSQLRCRDLDKDQSIDEQIVSASEQGITGQALNKATNNVDGNKSGFGGERASATNRFSFDAQMAVSPHPEKEIPYKKETFAQMQRDMETLPVDENDDDETGVQQILELLCVLGTATRHLCQYQCQEALQIFLSLPHSQYHTGWVLHQVGRAYFELADYHNAQRALESMETVEPHRIQGLEILSTTLWHLKKEVALSVLAQRAIELNRLSPEAWCIVGNCFSLQKEHENALICFKRSLQLDNNFTYSHTLSGHEYASNDDFEKAISCFRNALRTDQRHYNAWYGLGAIYFRQEKYDLAEKHFEKALSINPNSSVLHCNLGMAQFARGKPLLALETLTNAFRLDPRNPQARFQRATIFMCMDKAQEALEELEKVRDAAPKEPSVHFAMGKVYKRLGRPEKAMRCFLTALDLDPKDNKLICAAMERLNEPDVEEDIATF